MIIFNWDVIAQPGVEMGSRRPDPDGVKLWNMFHQTNRGRIGLVVNADKVDSSLFETWLYREGIKAAFYEPITTNTDLKVAKIHRLSTLHGRADWYVDSDVDICTRLVRLGVRCFVYANPTIVLPEWRGERTPRPWAELAQELHDQAEQKARVDWDEPIDVETEIIG